MNRSLLLVAIFFAALGQSAIAAKTPVLDAAKTNKLFKYAGKNVIVRGAVISIGKSEADKIRFLDFTKDREKGFVAAIFPVVFKALGNLEKYQGHRVQITGKLETYKAKMQIKVVHENQLTLLPDR